MLYPLICNQHTRDVARNYVSEGKSNSFDVPRSIPFEWYERLSRTKETLLELYQVVPFERHHRKQVRQIASEELDFFLAELRKEESEGSVALDFLTQACLLLVAPIMGRYEEVHWVIRKVYQNTPYSFTVQKRIRVLTGRYLEAGSAPLEEPVYDTPKKNRCVHVEVKKRRSIIKP